MTRIRLSNRAIIIICILLGLISPIILELNRGRGIEHYRYIPPPASPVAITGIDTTRWFEGDPHILAVDGSTYLHREFLGWAIVAQPSELPPSESCNEQQVTLIEHQAGAMVDCQQAQTSGEWCPGDILSIALTSDGNVWRLSQRESCTFLIVLGSLFCMPVGFFLGLVLVGFNLLRTMTPEERSQRWKHGQQS